MDIHREDHRCLEGRSELKLELIFVNDGRTDGTLEKILGLQGRSFAIEVVDLSRNFGKEAALTAGLRAVFRQEAAHGQQREPRSRPSLT